LSDPKCSCDKFERFEGASVNAYAHAFLEDLGAHDPARKNQYRCRVCGTRWDKRAPDTEAPSVRPALVKIVDNRQ
jgi:rubrerythrin